MNLPSTGGYPVSPASPDRPFPPVARPHGVSEVTPAKKITFFKSGDPQFGGVKMAINRRSFKSFSALMDDLSHKVPLPFGVRTITTPRGTHSINRLDQLQDGGSYICSDKKHVQPIAGRKTGPHRAMRPISARRQYQQEEPEEDYSATHFQQVPKLRKKIVLVKNGDPIVRQSILLNRRNARNFKTFLEDASDVLQFPVRRVYTVDGRRIENIQAVLQSPNVLICGGKETFKPIQSENTRNSFTEKLPGLQSHHHNHNSEIKDNKKNANFGLKAKKSVIHPRSASSNKTRLSLSSEKSYPNGVNMSPANGSFASYSTHSKLEDAGHSIVNDDIEKRVHVNKDGSLSVEMKVRFRLLNEETLQWSTQIKKSSTSGKAKCEPLCLYDENGKKENTELFSETDESFYPCDADSYSSKLNDAELEDMYCAQCGLQCQQYDIWKNPMHASSQEDYIKRASWQTRSSASSSSSHRKLVCDQKTSIDSLHTMSSEEYTEHVVHQSSCYSETRENGETMVRYSAVSRSTSRSGQSTAASNIDASSETNRKTGNSQHRSCSSRRSQISLRNQQSQQSEGMTHLKSQRESFEEYSEAPPTPCSESNHCSQRDNMVSQSSQHSSKKRLLKRSSANTKSFGSNISYNEDEEKGESNGENTPQNGLSTAMETGVSEEHCSSECAEQPGIKKEFNESDDHESGETAAPDVTLKSNNSECDKCSTRSSSNSKSSSKKCRQNNCSGHDDELLSHSPCTVSKHNSKNMLDHQESLEASDTNMNDNKSIKSCRKSYTERGQSYQSGRSLQTISPDAETALTQGEIEDQVPNEKESCNKSSNSGQTAQEDGQASLQISRPSSESQSFSSKYINVSCGENEKAQSSRDSTAAEKKSKRSASSETCDHKSSKGSAKTMSQSSQESINGNSHNENAELCKPISASESHCIHSPSPPKEKPANKHLRSSLFKYSNTSISSDPIKAITGEKIGSSRSSTPASKRELVAKKSLETCKMLKNSVTSLNSTEDIHSTKKRKNSTSSSKRKHKGESVEAENNTSSELTPSALPNVTPEEVVHEWLKKIPSQTMVVEYEVEECQKKINAETEASKVETDKEESGELNEVPTTEGENNHPIDDVNTHNECSDSGETADAKEENAIESNPKKNIEDKVITEEPACDQKSLPNNVQTSVQIMKALLNPSQDSKYDRSNSLPEVSQTMGRKLSNSAKVLISCLASLQLLEDSPGDPRKNSNDINTPKLQYNQLINILQALWAEGPTNKNIANIKSAKRYSREDEVTPVSSSGVDINSGFDGSGDGSITGGGDSIIIAEKLEDSRLSAAIKGVKCTEEITQHCEQDTADNQPPNTEDAEAGFEEVRPCVMDENMNEKKISDSFDRDVEDTTKESANSYTMNNVNSMEAEAKEDYSIMNGDPMNITGNETKSNECNSHQSSDINSPNDSHSTVKSTSDSNGKSNLTTDTNTFEADPSWILKLLKKIENEFMTHYVDAMNEFKVKWNLESNDTLDEMIAELKKEVGQRIQKSILYELKKIKSQGGVRMPKPPDGPRRRSSLQAEERRRRLQTMHQRSVHRYASSEIREGGTNDLSCDTDEEDLTFSASFGDDSSGQPNDDFCPCEKCLRQKRALKLAKPRPAASEAPIMKAFDLQQILKMKREVIEPKEDVSIIPSEQDCDKDVASGTGQDCPSNGQEETSEDNCLPSEPTDDVAKSDISGQDGDDNEPEGQEDRSVNEQSEVGNANGNDCETPCHNEMESEDSEGKKLHVTISTESTSHNEIENSEGENKSTGEVDDEKENGLAVESDDHSEDPQDKQMNCEPEEDNSTECEEEQQNNLEDKPNTEDSAIGITSENEDVKETSGPEEELSATEKCCENGDCNGENGTSNPVINLGTESDDDDNEADESCALYFQKSLARGSLITQNGSAEDIGECKEDSNTLGEMSPNGQSNGSGSKQSQMYPESSSEEEDSPRASPAGKNESVRQVCLNNKGSFEENESKPKKDLEDIIDQDDLDF